jgi:hypothetical protein
MKSYKNQEVHLHKSTSLPIIHQVHTPETGFPLFSKVFFSFSIEKKEVNKEQEIKKEVNEEPESEIIIDREKIIKHLEECNNEIDFINAVREFKGQVRLTENYDEFY